MRAMREKRYVVSRMLRWSLRKIGRHTKHLREFFSHGRLEYFAVGYSIERFKARVLGIKVL